MGLIMPQIPQQFGFGQPNSNTQFTVGMMTSDAYDHRVGLAAADGSAITILTTSVTGAVYDVSQTIHYVSGSVTSGLYVVGWTSGGLSFTSTVSLANIKVAGSGGSAYAILPDVNTAITVQLTTLTGSVAVVSVASTISRVL